MDLNFLGRGASSNVKEGNTSAYFIDNGDLFLIDCGESVYAKLIENNILEGIDNIYLMITHTHPDHFGSAGNLAINYFYKNKMKKKIHIILPKKAKHKRNIKMILKYSGCKGTFDYINEKKFDNMYNSFISIRYVKTDHCDAINCYGIIFTTQNGLVYYSGDTRNANILKALIASGEVIDKIYIDTTEKDPVHLDINTISSIVPEELKSHVYCMHFKDDKIIELAQSLGFNVVETIEGRKKELIKKLKDK